MTLHDRQRWQAGQRGPEAAGRVPVLADDELAAVRGKTDLGIFPPLTRSVIERVVAATADHRYVTELITAEPWLGAAVGALADGAPVVADSPMVAAGLVPSGLDLICKWGDSLTFRLARTASIELPAAAVRLALAEAGPGAIWVVGCEPAAIGEILSRGAEPALVIGMPAGFVAAAAAKQALRDSGMPALTCTGVTGGPAAAVAACLALVREAANRVAGQQLTGSR